MNEADALDLIQASFRALTLASAPVIIVAMVVGTGIALIQALTQVQEVTLTFVPKIVAVMAVSLLAGPFMAGQINGLALLLYQHIADGF
jgi:flagellar biosynthetic protein FliQ